MISLRKTLAVAATAAALAVAALAASPASAHGFGGIRAGGGHFGGGFGFHEHFRFGFHERFGMGFHHPRFCHFDHCGPWGGGFCRWHYCGPRFGGGWGWGGGWGGYRRIVVEGEIPVRVCPPGFHLGYEGKHCWPNR